VYGYAPLEAITYPCRLSAVSEIALANRWWSSVIPASAYTKVPLTPDR